MRQFDSLAQSLRIDMVMMAVLVIGLTARIAAEERFTLRQKDVVVFVGGANMLHQQQSGNLEAMLSRQFAWATPRFRDLSWEADTVFRQGSVIERWRKDGFGSRDDQLKRVGATVIVAQFGQLESLAGTPGVQRFKKAYEQLIASFKKQTRRIVLVTPTPFEKPDNLLVPDLSKRNPDLASYVKAIIEIAAEQELTVVDLFTGSKARLTDNGMHVTDSAQYQVAAEMARQLGVTATNRSDLEPLRRAVVEKYRLWYDYWRPANWKLLYGDDSRRQFTKGGKNHIPFREEWKKLLPLIENAEQRVWQIARGAADPGPGRPAAEVLHGDERADIKQELAAFSTSNDLQVNLFASEGEGLTSPLAIRWDPAGRMYVTVTTTYPHVFPGDLPNDKIIVLHDSDGDGRADKLTVFAEGLNIPTGIELGDGGVYVGQNTELLFLKDTDGDGQADVRRVVLGGFGNGDSHQTINSFIWSPGGELYFGQGDGIESRVETPWGTSSLFQAGFYRFRPRRLQLHPLLDDFMGPGNPWGVAFDRWGQIFSVDGAGGVTFLSPGQVPTTHRLKLRTIGKPGGYCGIGYLSGRHLPKSMRGDFVIGDFKANRVKRFAVQSEGGGYSLEWKEPILKSRHRNFRPVDVKLGPDGAIYVVDWYNPITCHQDDAYRDPARDKAHGRIWRLSTKSPTIKPRDLSQASIEEVIKALASLEHWTRYQAKRALTVRDPASVSRALAHWVRSLDAKLPDYEHHLYEALGAYATIEVVEPQLLGRLLQARDHHARAYAVRIVGRWQDRLSKPLDLLASAVVDDHPLVRMEAVMACAAVPAADSIEVAARVVERPLDGWINYAFKQAVHHLRPYWMPAFQRGQLTFASPRQLAAVLKEAGGRDVLESLKRVVTSADLDASARASVIAAILAVDGPAGWRVYGLDTDMFTRAGRYDAVLHADALDRLIEVARLRQERPKDVAGALTRLLAAHHPSLQERALMLAGIWKVEQVGGRVLQAAADDDLALAVRAAAFRALVEMGLPQSRRILTTFAGAAHPEALRAQAIRALVAVDVREAARQAALLLGESPLQPAERTAMLSSFLKRPAGAQAFADALRTRPLQPAAARRLLRSLFSTGHADKALFTVLNQAIGSTVRTPAYSETYVADLVKAARQHGNAGRGAAIFKSVACNSCHKVGGAGGNVGPDLSAIGTTLSAQRIVEEMLWPERQVKEGYSMIQVLTDQGKLHQGYQRRTKNSQESGDLVIQELATGKLMTIKREDIDQQRVTGSPMPTGLTAVLSRSQLLDLIRYVSEIGKIK